MASGIFGHDGEAITLAKTGERLTGFVDIMRQLFKVANCHNFDLDNLTRSQRMV